MSSPSSQRITGRSYILFQILSIPVTAIFIYQFFTVDKSAEAGLYYFSVLAIVVICPTALSIYWRFVDIYFTDSKYEIRWFGKPVDAVKVIKIKITPVVLLQRAHQTVTKLGYMVLEDSKGKKKTRFFEIAIGATELIELMKTSGIAAQK